LQAQKRLNLVIENTGEGSMKVVEKSSSFYPMNLREPWNYTQHDRSQHRS